MPTPDFPILRLAVLKLAAKGEYHYRDAAKILADEFGLTEEERNASYDKSHANRFISHVAWAKVYLGQAGLTKTTKRGYFTITDAGRNVLAQTPNEISMEFLMQFPAFQDFMARSGQKSRINAEPNQGNEELAPEERMSAAHSEIETELAEQLLTATIESSPAFFEQLIVDLMLKMSYGGSTGNGQQLGKSGDGGFDGVIDGDALGLDRVYLQAKKYAVDNIIGASAIRDFSGALVHKGATKGVFVTTSGFTEAAITFAKETSQQRLILIDGKELTRLMIKYHVGVRTERIFELKKVDQDYFDEE